MNNQVSDLVAFDGTNIASRTGHCIVLGMEVLQGWTEWNRPVRVFSSPLIWQANDREGIVIVDPVAAWRVLERFDRFMPDTYEHGLLLEKTLQRPSRKFEIVLPCEDRTND